MYFYVDNVNALLSRFFSPFIPVTTEFTLLWYVTTDGS